MFWINFIVLNIQHQFYILKTLNFSIELIYIPSHIGISESEKIDCYAKFANVLSPQQSIMYPRHEGSPNPNRTFKLIYLNGLQNISF